MQKGEVALLVVQVEGMVSSGNGGHWTKAHVLFFKAHSSDPFSLKPSLDLPALPPPTTTTPGCLGEISYPFP